MSNPLLPVIRTLGVQPYEKVWTEMREFTLGRAPNTADEFWLVEHPSVFTLGQAGKTEHLIAPGKIPVVKSDRGGQVTYHGPGQLIIYLLVDLRRLKIGVRDLVTAIENSIIQLLANYEIAATAKSDAPGVYVDGAKIASLGLRIKKGCSYHGLSLNLCMDIEPYSRINVCGYQGLEVIQLADLVKGLPDKSVITEQLVNYLIIELGYNALEDQTE